MERSNSMDRYRELAQKWLEGTISPEEEQEFANWYNQNEDTWMVVGDTHSQNRIQYRNRIYNQVISRINQAERWKGIRWLRPAMAVGVLVMIVAAIAFYRFSIKPDYHERQISEIQEKDVEPGRDRARLTLSDGTVIDLDNQDNSVIRDKDGIRIRKIGGILQYEALEKVTQRSQAFNTIETPKGGQFKLNLPDGSRIWLNSASSLRYPVEFTGAVREVELVNGEAYFEIAPGTTAKGWPFRVDVKGKQVVEVLGTHFNIMAYPDEDEIRTALLEGSVRVMEPGEGNAKLLKPGEQASLGLGKTFEIKKILDLEEATIAWVNGRISFRDADIETIMRQVARWYDVEVVYKGSLKERKFTGGISRSSNLSALLKILELNDIHFELQGRTLTVSP